jgi:hypothetical protein
MQFHKIIQQDLSQFGEIAKEYSDCNSHFRNGDCGKIGRGEIHQEECSKSLYAKYDKVYGSIDSQNMIYIDINFI